MQQHRGPPSVIVSPLPGSAAPPAERIPPPVVVAPLENEAQRTIGLAPPAVTRLPQTLWSGSDPVEISALLASLPDLRLPAGQALLYRALLTESFGPGDDVAVSDRFTLARAGALVRAGALDPAQALIEQSGITRDAAHFAAWMDVALLTGDEDSACDVLNIRPHMSPTQGHRVFCAVRGGDWPTAALLFDTGRALGTLPPAQVNLLERFLDPEQSEGDPALAPPAEITPLLFRLHESIGEPLPTRFLPRAYAVADLRDLAGWKAQLEAAERLARAGTLPDNQLLGLYTARSPAASGGIWDRVSSLQKFDFALSRRNIADIADALPGAWSAMTASGLEVSFAGLYGERLSRLNLTGEAAIIAQKAGLLSAAYQDVASLPGTDPVLAAIARGEPAGVDAQGLRADAVSQAFSDAAPLSALIKMAGNDRLGEALLKTLVLLEDGAAGDPVALRDGLATLRALGQEDTARRAALQILLLDRNS